MKIDRTDAEVFDVETEKSLRFFLNDVEKEKLLEDATRQIALKIISKPEAGIKPVLVNFYYRESDLRLTPYSFARSVDDVVFWCNLLESAIRPLANEELGTILVTEKHATELLNSR